MKKWKFTVISLLVTGCAALPPPPPQQAYKQLSYGYAGLRGCSEFISVEEHGRYKYALDYNLDTWQGMDKNKLNQMVNKVIKSETFSEANCLTLRKNLANLVVFVEKKERKSINQPQVINEPRNEVCNYIGSQRFCTEY